MKRINIGEPARVGPGVPLVFDFGTVDPGENRVAIAYPKQATRLGGEYRSCVYRHGRVSSFQLMGYIVGNHMQTLQPFPLALFDGIYREGPSVVAGQEVPVKLWVVNLDTRKRSLVLALSTLVLL